MKKRFQIFLLPFLLISICYGQTAQVSFSNRLNQPIGTAEIVDSWFLGLPAFDFKLTNIPKGKYYLSAYSGKNCDHKSRGSFMHLIDSRLEPWHTDKLLTFNVADSYDFNGILSLKPDKVNESTRSLLTAQKFINHPLVIYNDKSNFEACGVAVAIE